MPHLRSIFRLCVTLAATALLAVLLLPQLGPRSTAFALAIRGLVFSRSVPATVLAEPPAEFRRHGLLVDPAPLEDEWRQWLRTTPRFAALDTLTALEPMARATALLRLYATGPDNRNGCGRTRTIRTTLLHAGCCTDHTEAFLALAPVVGLTAREVGFGTHAAVEIYLPASHGWALIDPTYGLAFRDGRGAPLSLLEVRSAKLERRRLTVDTLLPMRWSANSVESARRFYAADAFVNVVVSNGTNVLEEDRWRRSVRFLPKSVARLSGHLLGLSPIHLELDDRWTHRRTVARSFERAGLRALVALVVLGLALYPVALVLRAWRPRRPTAASLVLIPRRAQ